MNDDPLNQGGPAPMPEGGQAAPHEYDFSADLNISEVGSDEKDGKDVGPLPSSISEAVKKSLSELENKDPGKKPGLNVLEAQPKPEAEPRSINKLAPEPVMEKKPPIDLDKEWPFASKETLGVREEKPAVMTQMPVQTPKSPAPVPSNLPTGDTPAPLNSVPRPSSFSGMNLMSGNRQADRPATQSSEQAPNGAEAAPAASGTHPWNLKSLRTYEGDVADALAARPMTRTSIALAESKKRGQGEVLGEKPAAPSVSVVYESGHSSGIAAKIIMVAVALLLIAGGVLGGYYLYSNSLLATADKPVAPDQSPKQVPAIVPYDSQSLLSIDQASSADIVRRVRAEMYKAQAPNTIKEIVLLETKDGSAYRATAPEALLLAAVPMPDIIARTLAPEWMLGTYSDETGTTTSFVIARTNLFQNAFAGMLAWEPSMLRDLQPFLGLSYDEPLPKGAYQDRIIKNKDVRAFVSADGKTLFEYSFVDNATLAFAANDQALSAIIERLENKAFVR